MIQLTSQEARFVADLTYSLREQMFKMPIGPFAYVYAVTAITRALKSYEDDGVPFPYDILPVLGSNDPDKPQLVATVSLDVREKGTTP